MARLSVYMPPQVLKWLEQKALDEKRSVSQAASVELQKAFENDTWVPQGVLADHLIGLHPQATPLMDAVKKIRARRPSKAKFPDAITPEELAALAVSSTQNDGEN